jgi:hypothetical protein
VGRVPVPVVQVVEVLVVRHGHMTALRRVLVVVTLVGSVPGWHALVRVIVVHPVNVAVVRVVGVIDVRERDMAAALAMSVLVLGVLHVLRGIWHDAVSLRGDNHLT